ncbi:hypothetical protein PAMA_004579 [Pampus argenteus]
MQQIYRQSDEQFEVYTTVFSPQVCRSRTRRQHVEAEKGSDSSTATPTLLRRGSVPVVVTTTITTCSCTSGSSTPKLLRKNTIQSPLEVPPHSSPSLLHRVLAKSRRKSCPHLPHPPSDTGSVNTAFQPD